jgi:Tfp pilus assembly protein PilF
VPDTIDDSDRPTRETMDRRIAEAELAVAAGLKNLATGKVEDATAYFGQALAHDPSNEQAHLWLLVCQARTLEAQGKADLARARYEAVLALDPKHREALKKTGKTADRPTVKRKRRWFGGDS